MTIPPRRNTPLFVLSAGVLGWVLAFLLDLRFFPRDLLPPKALISTAIGSLSFPLAWLVREERRAIQENRARTEALFTPIEVIPIERIKPPGYDRRKPRQGVITVSKHRVRLVPQPPPGLTRRKALGLGSHWPRGENQKRGRGWYRRIVW